MLEGRGRPWYVELWLEESKPVAGKLVGKGLLCLLWKPAALGRLREGLGRVAAAGRVLPSLLPARFAGLLAQKGCVEHARFGVN